MDVSTPVLVLGPPRYVGPLGVMRSLGRLGVRVYALRHQRTSAPNSSRFCAGTVDAGFDGRPSTHPERDLDQLLEAGRRLGGGTVLIAGSDEWAFFVAEHAGALTARFRFPRTPISVVRRLTAKDGLYELALEHGIPSPRIAFPGNRQDAERVAVELTYPVFVKPVVSRPRGQWKEIAGDPQTLLAVYRLMEEAPDAPNVMFQEYIPGEDADVWMLDGYFDADGRCLAAATGQKLRQHPARMGIATLGECRHNDEVVAITRRLVERTGYRGLVDIGYRYDRRDGTYKILDFNPRLGGAFRLFVDDRGTDLARIAYLDLTGQPVPPLAPADGRRWLKEDADIIAFKYYRRLDGLTTAGWLRSVVAVDEGATLSLRDPAPFAVSLLTLAYQTISRRWSRRIRRGRRVLGQLVARLRPRPA